MLKNMNYIAYKAINYYITTPLYVLYIIFYVKNSQCNLKGTNHYYVSTAFVFIVQIDSALLPLFAEYYPCLESKLLCFNATAQQY